MNSYDITKLFGIYFFIITDVTVKFNAHHSSDLVIDLGHKILFAKQHSQICCPCGEVKVYEIDEYSNLIDLTIISVKWTTSVDIGVPNCVQLDIAKQV